MIATAEPVRAPKMGIQGFPLPGWNKRESREPLPHEIDLPHPAIEELPAFLCRIDSAKLSHGIRHYNGSIARHKGLLYMAYRVESFRGVSSVSLCELDERFNVLRDSRLHPELSVPETHIEDPHMASVGGRLFVIVANVVRGFPNVCRQRLFEVCPQTLSILNEIPVSFGQVNGIEKNWTPFELPDGSLGIVYKQTPVRTIINVATAEGWTVGEVGMKPPGDSCSMSCRTGPIRINDRLYLEFVGGHIKMPARTRGTRYWFGALVFDAKAPFKPVAWTESPLAWGSEASGTIFNPISGGGGHPPCIIPAGAVLIGDDVFLSCNVNDSYIVMLRYNVKELIGKMVTGSPHA